MNNTSVPTINQTACQIREVAYCLPATPCDRCQHPAPRFSTAHRTAIDLALDHPILLHVTVSVHHCAACQHYFRVQPPFLRPDAIYTNRVVEKAVQSVYQDKMAMRCVSTRLARDFWVQPSEGMIRMWCRTYRTTFDFALDYQPWVVREFSGILCVDEVYQDQLALLLAVDPAAPEGDRLVGYQLVHGSVDAVTVEAFLTRLQAAGIQPDEVVTDGSALYPSVVTKVWPTVAHQLCLFHETRRVTKAVQEVISTARKSIPTPPPGPGRGRSGPIRATPPTDDPSDPVTQRWAGRQAERQRLLAQVHMLARQGHSQRAIARATGLHRQTVKMWLQQEVVSVEEVVPPAAVTPTKPLQPARCTADRPALKAQVHALAHQGLSYSAIARQTQVHRVTVKAWLQQEAPAALDAEPSTPVVSEAVPDVELLPSEPAATLAPPPAPWTSWDEVRQVREALQEHRFLLLRRPEHLNAEQQAHVAALLESPLGSQLQVARAFLEEWYGLWRDETGQRRTLEEAQARYVVWQTKPEYGAIAPLRRVQERMTPAHFERLSQFLRHPAWEATNNGAERAGRAFRHRQAPHFNLRKPESVEGALIVTACQHKAAATAQAAVPIHTCQRGRQRRQAPVQPRSTCVV